MFFLTFLAFVILEVVTIAGFAVAVLTMTFITFRTVTVIAVPLLAGFAVPLLAGFAVAVLAVTFLTLIALVVNSSNVESQCVALIAVHIHDSTDLVFVVVVIEREDFLRSRNTVLAL